MSPDDVPTTLAQAIAERDAALAELDRIRSIPELRVGQRLRAVLGRVRKPRTGACPDPPPVDEAPPTQRVAAGPIAKSTSASTAWLDASISWDGSPLTSLAVQVVLFENEPDQQLRLAAAIRAALQTARTELGLAAVSVRYGDCSPQRCLTGDDVEAIRDVIGDAAASVDYVFFDANLGSSGGSNALAELADDEVIWVLNPDTFPAPSAAAELLAALSADGVGAAEARQLPIEHPKYFDPTTGDTSWVCGFGVMFRRAAFDEVGGFDSHFFPMYCDDVDISWRLRSRGWAIRHVPAAAIFHDKPISVGGSVRWSDDAARWSHLARLWLYRRYGRPDLEAEFLASVDSVTDPIAAEAIEEFERRVADGDVPEVLPGGVDVAVFVDGEYAPTRFGYTG